MYVHVSIDVYVGGRTWMCGVVPRVASGRGAQQHVAHHFNCRCAFGVAGGVRLITMKQRKGARRGVAGHTPRACGQDRQHLTRDPTGVGSCPAPRTTSCD